MSTAIGPYLRNIRRRLIRSQRYGFDPDPQKIPETLYVSRLAGLRELPFLEFRRSLIEDRVLLCKVIPSPTITLLQEALLLCNLSGQAALIDLTELSKMTDDQQKNHPFLLDVKGLLLDENSL